MDYHKAFIIDFARRTKANLERIETLASDGDEVCKVYEVTQLANSLLGLLVFPREHYIDNIPPTPLSELAAQGWPEISPTFGELPHDNLKEFMRVLRNSIAHCNVEFRADSENQIDGLRIWNTKRGKKTWEAHLSLKELRLIAFKFVELIEQEQSPWDADE